MFIERFTTVLAKCDLAGKGDFHVAGKMAITDADWATRRWREYRNGLDAGKSVSLSAGLVELGFMTRIEGLPFHSELCEQLALVETRNKLCNDALACVESVTAIVGHSGELEDFEIESVEWRISILVMMMTVIPSSGALLRDSIGAIRVLLSERVMNGREKRMWGVWHRTNMRTWPPFRLLWGAGREEPPWPHHLKWQ